MSSDCPRCNQEMRSRRMDSGRWLFSCTFCEICFATDQTGLSQGEARDKLAERYEEGALQSMGRTWVRRHGLGKDLRLLDMGIESGVFEKLPPDIKRILRGGDEVVEYEFMDPTSPPLASGIEDSDLNASLEESLKERGIDSLFDFQEEAVEEILKGQNVLISAPTATGKTERVRHGHERGKHGSGDFRPSQMA